MLDRRAITLLAPLLQRMAAGLVRLGVGADSVTLAGFALGLAGAAAVAAGAHGWGLALLLASRWADGLDGAVARLTRPTDRGAFLDITLDFLFYASVPLAFAVLAERRGLKSTAYPHNGLYYLGGLTEASETLLCFVLMCLWPQHFAGLAYGFAALCGLTIATRLALGWAVLGEPRG